MIKKACIGLHVECPLFLSDFNETGIFFRPKILKYQFHNNRPSRSRVVPCGRTDGQTCGHDEANSRFPEFSERS